MKTGKENGALVHPCPTVFVDRRNLSNPANQNGRERRQFSDSHSELTDDAAELGRAMDSYKVTHRRRYINYEEMLEVIRSLGYRKAM